MHELNALQSVSSAHLVIRWTAARGAALPLGGFEHPETQLASVILPPLAGMHATARLQSALHPASSSFAVASAPPP